MKSKFLIVFALISSCVFAQPNIWLTDHLPGFSSPVDIANCGDDRLFIVEKRGTIQIIKNGAKLSTPFLDINSIVINGGNEEGLLGMAFHPDYRTNGYFFVYYVNNSSNLVISRFSVTANPDSADAASETEVITINHPGEDNHNGGNLEFGKDGYLYIATGDGGGAGDPNGNAQNLLSLLGKMLRLDVDALPYTIPATNPFISSSSIRGEIWALGLRNPWRFSFDRLTGDMWIGDVGQGTREEVNFMSVTDLGGRNYGWKCYEGNQQFASTCPGVDMNEITFPVYDYDNNTVGCSVVGGYRYRGCEYPDMFGYYIFADYCSGRFWTTHDSSGTWVTNLLFNDADSRYCAFGEDKNGEIYVAGLNGRIYKVVEDGPAAMLPTIVATGDIPSCPNELTLSLQGSFVSFEWLKDGIAQGSGGQYSVAEEAEYGARVTASNGCVYTTPDDDGIDIDIYPIAFVPEVTGPQPTMTCSNCPSSDYVYQWYYYPHPDEAEPAFSAFEPLPNDTLTQAYINQTAYIILEVTDSNGCKTRSDTYAQFVGIEETWLGQTTLQPNPFSNEIILNYTLKATADIRITLKDLTGKEVALLLQEKKPQGSHTLPINATQYQLSKGVYLLEIANGNSRKVLRMVKM